MLQITNIKGVFVVYALLAIGGERYNKADNKLRNVSKLHSTLGR